MLIKRISFALLAAMLFMGVAHAEEKDLVKYRLNVMKVIGAHMGSIAALVKGKVPYKDDLGYHADSLAAAVPMVLPAFKAKAMSEKSEALPGIWENWHDFEQAANKLDTESANFSKAVATGDMAKIGPALGALGKSCKSCHDDFMEEH